MNFTKISFRPTPLEGQYLQQLWRSTAARNTTELMHIVMSIAMQQQQQQSSSGFLGTPSMSNTTSTLNSSVYGDLLQQKSFPTSFEQVLSTNYGYQSNSTMTAHDTYLGVNPPGVGSNSNAAATRYPQHTFSQSRSQFQPLQSPPHSPTFPLPPPSTPVPSWLVDQVHTTAYLAVYCENLARIRKAQAQM